MYKVILVDDDELVRVGLESLVSFSKKGFQIIDSLSNAKQALDSIRKNQPDVVITDMYMPEINGVQLIREGKQLCPSAIFIVLSCQNNIDFIKEALRAGATDYLLKSSIVNPKSTASLLDKISDACQIRHRLSGTAPAESDPKAMLREYLRGGAVSPEILRQELYRRGFDAANGGLHLSALQFNHYESMSSCSGSEEALLAKIEQYIDDFLSEYGAGLCVHDEKGCFLLLQQIRASALSITSDDRLLSICERLRLCAQYFSAYLLHICLPVPSSGGASCRRGRARCPGWQQCRQSGCHYSRCLGPRAFRRQKHLLRVQKRPHQQCHSLYRAQLRLPHHPGRAGQYCQLQQIPPVPEI